jgi:two-component system, NtrC family, nitrogen regulation sensor histidine kinase NtrY
MIKEGTFRHFIYQQGYLLIISAWLFTLSFVISNYWSYTSSSGGVTRSLQSYINENERRVEELVQDRTLLSKFYSGNYSLDDLKSISNGSFFVYLYPTFNASPNQPIFWSTNAVMPDKAILAGRYGSNFSDLPNGRYVSIKKEVIFIDGHTALMVALIPVQWNYYHSPQENGFVNRKGVEQNYDITFSPGDYPVKSIDQEVLFYLQRKADSLNQSHSWWTVVTRVCCILFFLFFIHTLALWIARRFRWIWGILSLTAIVVFFRWLTYILPIPFDMRQFGVFDPGIYSSGLVLRSLGDLLIDTLLYFWLVVFALDHLSFRVNPRILQDYRLRWAAAVFVALAILIVTLLTGNIVRSLVADSQISFSVTNFFSILNFYSLYGFICFCGVALGYFFTIQILYRYYVTLTEERKDMQFLILTVLGLVSLSLRMVAHSAIYELMLLAWLLLFLLLLGNAKRLHMAENLRAGNIIFWLFFFSASIAMLIIRENSQKEEEQRIGFAMRLSRQADPSSYLNLALNNFTTAYFYQNFNRFQDEDASQFFKDSLISENFTNYPNKYDTRFYVYDVFGKPLNNPDSTSFNSLENIYNFRSSPTEEKDLFYHREAFDKYAYIIRRVVEDSSTRSRLGYVFLIARPKQFESEAFYSELLSNAEDEPFNSPEYAWAIYDSGELIKTHNDYPFSIHLSPNEFPITETETRWHGGNQEVWYKSGTAKVVVVVRKTNYFIEAVTLFAYLFCIFLVLSGTMQLAGFLIRARFRWKSIKELWQVNIRTQVHTTIMFISLFSFIIIGISTILFFRNRYRQNNEEKLSKTILIMATELQSELGDPNASYSVMQAMDSSYNRRMESILGKVAAAHGVTVNLYDPSGTLRYTSQPFYYSKGLLSEKMDPAAYFQLVDRHQVQCIQDEYIGSRNFMSIYIPVRDEKGQAYAYLNIPYFATQDELNLEISNFLVTLINLNAFIFLVAGMIALLVTNRITDSFSIIGEKMKDIKLGKVNEEIVWKSNNELGELVKQYNKMVRQLERSADLLAKSEREGAWRDMARQVAHEIKNPLTPMKLSIQYLQKAINNNHPNAKALSANVAKTLIEQIDYLANIATDFSSFANIANPKREKVDLVEVLESVVKLFSMDTSVRLLFEKTVAPVYIIADKTHVNRLITNLVRNAMDAVPDGEVGGLVQLRYVVQENHKHVTVIVQDNGTGIPEEVRDKIFVPNFTTKSSGTGLGLAMSKGITEQMNASLWFDTKLGEGTTFYVQIPLVEED